MRDSMNRLFISSPRPRRPELNDWEFGPLNVVHLPPGRRNNMDYAHMWIAGIGMRDCSRLVVFSFHERFSGRVVPERFRDGVVQGIDNHAVRAAERLFLAVRHDGHTIPEPEVQGRAAVEGELAFRGARKHVSSDASSTGERINLDLLERLDPGRSEKLGTY